jgi:hypothetical protein
VSTAPVSTESRVVTWAPAAATAAAGRDRAFYGSPFALEASRLEREEGAARRAEFLRGVLALLLEQHKPLIEGLAVPQAVKQLVEREYRRIERLLSKGGDDAFDLRHHTMRCDFRIVAFGRIPAGIEHIELGGVPRSLVWTGDVKQALQVGSALLRAGGATPFYSAHLTHGIKPWAFLMAYNSETQAVWHRNVAECLVMNPGVRGLIASSWWYDPQMASVAPHLEFLTRDSLAHGAVLARVGPTEGSTNNALAHSPERQRLYANGTYRPVSYSVIWTREALIRWAERG